MSPRAILHGRAEPHLPGNIGIDEILLHNTFLNHRSHSGRHSFRIEKTRTGLSLPHAVINHRKGLAEKLFAKALRKEAVVLLQGVAAQGIEQGSKQLGGYFGIHHHSVFPSLHRGATHLLHSLGKGSEPGVCDVKAFELWGGFPPVAAVFPAVRSLHRQLGNIFERSLHVPAHQSVAVGGEAVQLGIRILALL